MENFNIVKDESYIVNYKIIMKYINEKQYALSFWIRKVINRNENIKAFILNLYERDAYEIEKFGLLDHDFTRSIFQAFTMVNEPWEINQTYINLRCYDMCISALKKKNKIFSTYFLQEFKDVTPTYEWEEKIQHCFGNSYLKNEYTVEELKKECIQRIRNSFEMRKFIQSLRYKKDKNLNKIIKKRRKQTEKMIDKLIFLKQDLTSNETKEKLIYSLKK